MWAPHAKTVDLVLDGGEHRMDALDRGWWRLRASAGHHARYAYRLDGGLLRPDPASRHQPEGVHGRSAVIDTDRFSWSVEEEDWRPAPLAGAVIYELHIGAFTPEGTFAAAAGQLEGLREMGVSHVEVMPVNAFNGPRGWGYDGVGWYAVHEPYGGPAEFAQFVDACHRLGLAVLLDVVYNHLGPSGNYLPDFGPYLTDSYETPWGQSLNLDEAGADEVRSFVIGNALMWLADYHVDGLRLDAVHGLVDNSAVHLLSELSEAVADLAPRVRRGLQLIAESDRQDPKTVRPRAAGGLGLDGQWLDDLHHGIHVAVTGEHEGYYADFTGLRDVAASFKRGFVYDGRYSRARGRTVGAPLGDDVPSHRLVACVQNHDQIGNRAHGDRLTTLVEPALARAAIALLCTAPTTPMLFMGEEYGETNPFLFFSGHPEPELSQAVREGRRAEFAHFSDFAGEVPDPQDPQTFQASKLDWTRADSAAGRQRRALWTDLLSLRRRMPALSSGRRDLVEILEADEEWLAVLRRHPSGPAALILANLAAVPRHAVLDAADDPWTLCWSSDDERYGGGGGHIAADVEAPRLRTLLPAATVCVLTSGDHPAPPDKADGLLDR